MKKYEFTGVEKKEYGITLKQIRLLVDLPFAFKGSIGGWIESEKNLSHDGNCWVYGNGQVSGYGQVSGNGRVYGNGQVCGYGRVYGNGQVSGYGQVSGNGLVFGNGQVFENGQVSGNGLVFGNGQVFENGQVSGNGRVSGNGLVFGNGQVFENGKVFENGRVSGNGLVFGNGQVFENGRVSGNGQVSGYGVIKHKFIEGVCVNVTTKPFNISYSGFEEVDGKKVHYVSVGCQDHKIEDWLNPGYRFIIISENKFPKQKIESFLGYLNCIISDMDLYKVENNTIKVSLTNRDPKTGRFLKKTP